MTNQKKQQTSKSEVRDAKKGSRPRSKKAASPGSAKTTYQAIARHAIHSLGLADARNKELMAVLGIEGYCKRPLACDGHVRNAIKQHLEAIMRRESEGAFADRPLFQIDIHDDNGLTPAEAPELRLKVMAERATKMLVATGLHGISMPLIRPARPAGGLQATQIVTGSRSLAFAPSGMDAEDVRNMLGRRISVTTALVPQPRVVDVASDRLDVAVGRLVNLPTRAVALRADDANERNWSPATAMTDAEAWRQFQCLAEIPFPLLLVGIGQQGRAWTAELKQKILASQRARVETGLVLPADYDAWATGVLANQEAAIASVPVRTDAGMKLPPAVPKPKTKARREKEAREKAKRRRNGAGHKPRPTITVSAE